MPNPYTLRVGQYEDDDCFYLLYLDHEGNELTDTYHDSLAGAFEQAKWEFGIELNEWKKVLS